MHMALAVYFRSHALHLSSMPMKSRVVSRLVVHPDLLGFFGLFCLSQKILDHEFCVGLFTKGVGVVLWADASVSSAFCRVPAQISSEFMQKLSGKAAVKIGR